ncbi:MAG: DUF5985 family protein [Bdellovibrionota bacterium]
MAEYVYIGCAIMSIGCAVLLFRGYLDARSQLLLWSSLCFGFLAFNNVILFFDLVIFPQTDFEGVIWRNLMSSVAGSLLLFGLVWELT